MPPKTGAAKGGAKGGAKAKAAATPAKRRGKGMKAEEAAAEEVVQPEAANGAAGSSPSGAGGADGSSPLGVVHTTHTKAKAPALSKLNKAQKARWVEVLGAKCINGWDTLTACGHMHSRVIAHRCTLASLHLCLGLVRRSCPSSGTQRGPGEALFAGWPHG